MDICVNLEMGWLGCTGRDGSRWRVITCYVIMQERMGNLEER